MTKNVSAEQLKKQYEVFLKAKGKKSAVEVELIKKK